VPSGKSIVISAPSGGKGEDVKETDDGRIIIRQRTVIERVTERDGARESEKERDRKGEIDPVRAPFGDHPLCRNGPVSRLIGWITHLQA